jgi:hypothetical protein
MSKITISLSPRLPFFLSCINRSLGNLRETFLVVAVIAAHGGGLTGKGRKVRCKG